PRRRSPRRGQHPRRDLQLDGRNRDEPPELQGPRGRVRVSERRAGRLGGALRRPGGRRPGDGARDQHRVRSPDPGHGREPQRRPRRQGPERRRHPRPQPGRHARPQRRLGGAAVRNSVNINAEEAVRLHVADLEVPDIKTLLNQLDGRESPRPNGSVVFHTAGAIVDDFPMPFWQIFLNALIDPTIAALLIIVAGYGIITELSNPGLILPGVVGGLAAILAIVSLANLPVNIAGALLMLLALVLFIADLKAPTHGFLSVGGVFALLLGMAFLINTG